MGHPTKTMTFCTMKMIVTGLTLFGFLSPVSGMQAKLVTGDVFNDLVENDVLSDGKFTFRVVTALNVVDPTYEAEYERSGVANTAAKRLSRDQLRQLHHLRQGIRIIKVQYGEMLPAVPDGWKSFHDSNHNRFYYQNTASNAVQWVKPRGSPDRYEWVPHNSDSRNYAFEDLKGSCQFIGTLQPLPGAGPTVAPAHGHVHPTDGVNDKEPPLVWKLAPQRRRLGWKPSHEMRRRQF